MPIPTGPSTFAKPLMTCAGGSAMADDHAAARALLTGDELTTAMVGIGMGFAADPEAEPNIEDTLIAASIEGMERDDMRVLAILVTWLEAHHAYINAHCLLRAIRTLNAPRVRAFWAAVGQWLHKDRRFARFTGLCESERIDLLRTGTDFHVRRCGEDSRFSGSCLRVPAGVLRDRKRDVLSSGALAGIHRAYRFRILMGPTSRADMWAALEQDPTRTPADIARRAHGCHRVAGQTGLGSCQW
ncbi:MAG: hypothetical protein HYV63_22270 [Candidatus Schekmanbacteria bacterium]|nr:hypothetical protein [Candidatus Schekmanbacteria bacterium]